MTRPLAIALAVAVAVAALAACAGQGRPAHRRAAAPSDELRLVAETLDGARVEIGGPGPVRLVELWATWCEPCRPAADRAREVLARHPAVVAYAVAIDLDRAAVARAAAAAPPPGVVLVLPGGAGAAAQRGLPAVPTFVALDARGRVVGTLVGLTPSLAPALDQLLRRAEGKTGDRDGA